MWKCEGKGRDRKREQERKIETGRWCEREREMEEKERVVEERERV